MIEVDEIIKKTETYSETYAETIIGDVLRPSETSKMELFVKRVDCI